MEIKVNYLDNLRQEAKFDDFTVIADQPIRYKGDGSAPGPFDYFLASSALCAAYFVKVYCLARDIPTDNIRLSQNNIVDPENRYKQIFKIQVAKPHLFIYTKICIAGSLKNSNIEEEYNLFLTEALNQHKTKTS